MERKANDLCILDEFFDDRCGQGFVFSLAPGAKPVDNNVMVRILALLPFLVCSL